jgi:hypothetical protein
LRQLTDFFHKNCVSSILAAFHTQPKRVLLQILGHYSQYAPERNCGVAHVIIMSIWIKQKKEKKKEKEALLR